MRIVFDIETDNTLSDLTRMWVITLMDLDSDWKLTQTNDMLFRDSSFNEALRYLWTADSLHGHNILGFDLPALKKLYGFEYHGEIHDTLIESQLAYPEIETWDYAEHIPNGMPKKLAGRYGLEAWGWRLGSQKVGLDMDFSVLTPEMIERNVQDVVLNKKLCKLIEGKVPQRASRIEHELGPYLLQQETNGFPFDVERGAALAARLRGQQASTREALVEWGGIWVERGAEFLPARDNRRLGYRSGCACTRIEIVTFNPGSNQHIAKRLTDLYGWQPTEFTETGQPDVSEAVLSKLKYPLAAKLVEYKNLSKQLGYVSDGDSAWLKLYKEDGPGGIPVIHGRVNQLGAVTGRASHHNPNLGQVPSDAEFRELFYAPDGWQMVGVDMSGIELRMLAHYMAYFDGGAYGRIVLDGDVHQENADAWGVDRTTAKTGIYALIYGAGDAKLGRVLRPTLVGEDQQRQAGRRGRAALLGKFPALGSLTDDVKKRAASKGFLVGLDGRRLPVRSEHMALNTLLQSAAAVASKVWINRTNRKLTEWLGPQGWDGEWAALAWVHDEVQLAARSYPQGVADATLASLGEAGEELKLNIPLDGEARIGRTWHDTH